MRVRAYVRACLRVCVCAFLYYIFSPWYVFLFRINFQIHLISHALSLAGSVSIGAVAVSDARSITTGSCSSFIAIFFNQYLRSTDKT